MMKNTTALQKDAKKEKNLEKIGSSTFFSLFVLERKSVVIFHSKYVFNFCWDCGKVEGG